jgi:hypothetical protein
MVCEAVNSLCGAQQANQQGFVQVTEVLVLLSGLHQGNVNAPANSWNLKVSGSSTAQPDRACRPDPACMGAATLSSRVHILQLVPQHAKGLQ